ncbi:MAG: TraR/DksA family transcriptional regulator [Rubrivivax sp.]|nr:TraR/DksA family transcriptional regulator [Rubrivivax sp.]
MNRTDSEDSTGRSTDAGPGESADDSAVGSVEDNAGGNADAGTRTSDAAARQAFEDRAVQHLHDRQQQLAAEILLTRGERSEAPLGSAGGSADAPGDLADQAEQRSRQALLDAEALRDHEELCDIEAALERLAAGTYGECVDCDAVIGVQRLHVQPAAARCLPCQEQWERWERTHPPAQRTPLQR